MNGTVTWFDVTWFDLQKGFGFITVDGGQTELFVHVDAVERACLTGLRDGQRVSFEIVTDPETGNG